MTKTLKDGRIVTLQRFTFGMYRVYVGATPVADEYDYAKALAVFNAAS